MNQIETVAMMASTIYANRAGGANTTKPDLLYGRVANEAWDLYYAVQNAATEAATREQRRALGR